MNCATLALQYYCGVHLREGRAWCRSFQDLGAAVRVSDVRLQIELQFIFAQDVQDS